MANSLFDGKVVKVDLNVWGTDGNGCKESKAVSVGIIHFEVGVVGILVRVPVSSDTSRVEDNVFAEFVFPWRRDYLGALFEVVCVIVGSSIFKENGRQFKMRVQEAHILIMEKMTHALTFGETYRIRWDSIAAVILPNSTAAPAVAGFFL